MRVRDYIINELWEIIYLIIMVLYLFNLNALNKELSWYDFSSPFELLQYRDYAPLIYFGFAVVLFIIGCLLVFRGVHRIQWEMELFGEIVVSCLGILIVIILLVLLIIFIDNPILRAVFVAGLVILGVSYSGK